MLKSYIITFLFGFLSAFSLPSFFLLPFFIIGFYYLFYRIKNLKKNKEYFLHGLVFGFGHFLLGFHWIIFPFFFDQKHYLLAPIIIIIFPLFLSLFLAFPSLILGIYYKKFKLNISNIFINSFIIGSTFYFFEYFRCILFGGLPWNLFAHIWAFNNSFLTITKYIGVYGLSFLTIFWVILIIQFILIKKYRITGFIFSSLPILLLIIGPLEKQNPSLETVKVRLVQPNIPQDIKWSKYYFEESIQKLINLSKKKREQGNIPNIIIWPEVAIASFLNENSNLRKRIINSFNEKTVIITGALRREQFKVFNSLYLISKSSVNFYDKRKLVPFGEFIPLRSILPFKKLTEGSTDFTRGFKRKALIIDNHESKVISFEPSICYEGIFPEKDINGINLDFLVNITNDAWFGNTTGPQQHLVATKFRSIERGLPLVRVANSGISAAFNKNGKIIQLIPHNTEGFVDVVLEIDSNQTIYSKYGDVILILLLSFFLIITLVIDFFLKKKVAYVS